MKIIIAIFAWGIYSVITLSAITNAIVGLYDKWFGNIYFGISGFLIICCGILIYAIAGLQFGSLKKISGIEKDKIV